MASTTTELQRLLLEKQRECELYIQLAAERTEAGGGSDELKHMLASMLDIRHDVNAPSFREAVRYELDKLLANREQSRLHNLVRRGHATDERLSEHPGWEAQQSPSGKREESELTTAVANVNKVFDELVKRSQSAASNERPPMLEQWDVLSGVMDNPNLKRLLAMHELSLADCWGMIDQLFGNKAGEGGGGGGGEGGAAGKPNAPPIDRGRFEDFFLVRHLGMLEAFLNKQAPTEGGGGGEKKLSDEHWQDVIIGVEVPEPGGHQAFGHAPPHHMGYQQGGWGNPVPTFAGAPVPQGPPPGWYWPQGGSGIPTYAGAPQY